MFAGERLFNWPVAVAIDSGGNVYVADYGNDRVPKFTSAGKYLAEWGVTGSLLGEFNSPSGVAVDASGNVYVTDRDNNRIQVMSP